MSGKFYEKFEKKSSSKESKKKQRDFSTSPKSNIKKEIKAEQDSQKVRKPETKSHSQKVRKSDFKPKSYTTPEPLFSTNKLSKETNYILQHFDEIIQGVRPLNSKQIQQLPDNIKALSHQLTDKRRERRLGYMNDNIQLSSYVRYYTWWNLVRLTRLFSNLPASSFPVKDGICLDLGSGPLTVINALWLARPELRKLNLTWYCLDVSSNSMVLGEDIYMSLAARTISEDDNGHHWNIIRVKGSFGTSIKEKADFITCANMFNELDQASHMPPEFQSKKYFDQLKNYAGAQCKFLLVEPGVPKATRTLALLRERFIASGKEIASPCPHHLECPMNGFKAYTGSSNKWCNFCFSTEDAPEKLLKLSELAKLPKERATLIFVSAVNKGESVEEKAGTFNHSGKESKTFDETGKTSPLICRITSDPFRLPEYKIGYYGCSRLGLTLVKTHGHIEKLQQEKGKSRKSSNSPKDNFLIKGPFNSGDLIQVKLKTPESGLEKDTKSGATIIEL